MYHFFGFRVVASDAERVPADASTWWGRLDSHYRLNLLKCKKATRILRDSGATCLSHLTSSR